MQLSSVLRGSNGRGLASRARSIRAFSSLLYKEHGAPEKVLELISGEGPLAPMSAGSARTRLIAAPTNPSDFNQIEGVYPIKPRSGLPAVAGNEGVFEVLEATGDLQRGQKVMLLDAGFGTWAEERHFPREFLLPVPSGVPDELAATLCVNGVSALRMLEDFETIGPGDVVVQNGGNSAVGQLVIQLARARGAMTVNLVRDRPDMAAVKAHLEGLGADVVTTEARVREDMKGLPAPRLGMNCVGGASSVAVAKVLAPGSTMVTYGAMAKEPTTIPASLFIFKDLTCRGFWLSGRWAAQHGLEGRAAALQQLFAMAQRGEIRPPKGRHVTLAAFMEELKKGAHASGAPGRSEKTFLIHS